MKDYRATFETMVNDPRYRANLDWGEPRPGHPEGTAREHIAELERNLEALRPRVAEVNYWKLKLLIHAHDTFKAQARAGAAIADPDSHASLARAFLAEYYDDADLLAMIQHHDEPYALWRQLEQTGRYDAARFDALLGVIRDWNLFLAFCIVDGRTAGKSREPLRWFLEEVRGKVESVFGAEDF